MTRYGSQEIFLPHCSTAPLLHSSTSPLLHSPTPNTSCNDLLIVKLKSQYAPSAHPTYQTRIGAWRMIGGCKISRNIFPRILHIPLVIQSRNIMVGDPSPQKSVIYIVNSSQKCH